MMKISYAPITAAYLSLALFSCNDKNVDHVTAAQAPSAIANSSETDEWVGQWNGPEGTFLKLSGSGGKYEITIQNLDGPKVYSGISVDSKIQFQRNGIMENIHATNGEETGMKWLSEKNDCLTINRGEGFCRD